MSRLQILDIIAASPKTYHKQIAKDPELLDWVKANTLVNSNRLVEEIYSAIHQESNLCPHGNVKQFDRISTGFRGCGPAAVCQCTRESISASVVASKATADTAESNRRRRATMTERYGVEYNSQRSEVKQVLAAPKISAIAHAKLTDRDWLHTEYQVRQRSLVEIADQLGVYYSTVGEYCKRFGFPIRQVANSSQQERAIAEFVSSLGVQVIRNDWSVLGNQEIDILVPEYSFGIEVDGLFWHSYSPNSHRKPNPRRHIDKTLAAAKNGIEIVHITDAQWNTRPGAVKSLIQHKLGMNCCIGARQCRIQPISRTEAAEFTKQNSLQTIRDSTAYYGLFYRETLVSCAGVWTDDITVTVETICSLNGIAVVGGFSKIAKFLKTHYSEQTVTVDSDCSTASGASCKTIGMHTVSEHEPKCHWTDGNQIVDYRENSNLRQFWDCGRKTFKLC